MSASDPGAPRTGCARSATRRRGRSRRPSAGRDRDGDAAVRGDRDVGRLFAGVDPVDDDRVLGIASVIIPRSNGGTGSMPSMVVTRDTFPVLSVSTPRSSGMASRAGNPNTNCLPGSNEHDASERREEEDARSAAAGMAERVGFEPTALSCACFQDRTVQPLRHLSALEGSNRHALTRRRRSFPPGGRASRGAPR